MGIVAFTPEQDRTIQQTYVVMRAAIEESKLLPFALTGPPKTAKTTIAISVKLLLTAFGGYQLAFHATTWPQVR